MAVRGMTYLVNLVSNLVDENVIFKYVFNMPGNVLRLTCNLYDRSIVGL